MTAKKAGRKRWCVQHKDGWCLTLMGIKFPESTWNVETKCGHFVVLPIGCEKRKPTCAECLAAVGETR